MSNELPKVLIVDDEESILNSLARILSDKGYAVHTASNAIEAINYCRMNFYQAVILDCLLPDKSGLQLAKEIKPLQDKYTHFIFISGVYSDPSFINSCLSEVGGSRYYVKPFNASELVDYLDQILLGKFKQNTIFERLITLPNPSGAEVLSQLQKVEKIIGYELPFILAQFSRFKISRFVSLFQNKELCVQIRFEKGRIVQFFNFLHSKINKKSELYSLNEIVDDNVYEITISKPEGVTGQTYISDLEVKSWAEEVAFSYLPLYWVANQLLPIISCKIYNTSDFDIRLKTHEHWPISNPELMGLEQLVGCTLLQKMFSSRRKNEDLFYCVYNYLMNGSAWADSLKKSYSEEGLSHFFSWHYNLIAKRNRFEVLELMMDEKVEKSRILPIYKRVFKEIEDLNISPEINQWIELEGNFINACVNILERPRERNLYREEIESNKQGWLKLVRSQYDKLFSAFADNNSKLMLELIAPLQQYSSIPVELKLLGMWSELKEQGSQFSQDKLKEWQVQLLRLPIPQQFIYLKKINEGLIAKHTGQKPVARRLFLEAKKYNTECKIPDFEIRYLSHPEKQWPQWFNKTSAFIKKIQKNRVYPNN